MSEIPKKVRVIDDQESVGKGFRLMPEDADCEVIVLANGSQAVEVTERNPSLVVLGIKMSRRSSMEVLRKLKADCADHAVIIRTVGVSENCDYQLSVERKITEQTQLLKQKERELTALNNLFVKYLNQGFEAAEEYGRLADDITRMAKEAQSLCVQGSDAETRQNLANGILKAAGEIKALAEETQARRIEVQTSRAEEQRNSE